MVGYIQDWEFDDILHEVNEIISTHESSIPKLSLSLEGWQNQGVSRLQHTFQRPSTPSTFLLQHFWIDIRNCPLPPSASDTIVNPSEEKGRP